MRRVRALFRKENPWGAGPKPQRRPAFEAPPDFVVKAAAPPERKRQRPSSA